MLPMKFIFLCLPFWPGTTRSVDQVLYLPLSFSVQIAVQIHEEEPSLAKYMFDIQTEPN